MGEVVAPICKLCRHLVNQTHGENHIVCGMHVYGPAENDCADYQRLGIDAPKTSKFLPFQGAAQTGEEVELPRIVTEGQVFPLPARPWTVNPQAEVRAAIALNCTVLTAREALRKAERDYRQSTGVLLNRIMAGLLVLEGDRLVETPEVNLDEVVEAFRQLNQSRVIDAMRKLARGGR